MDNRNFYDLEEFRRDIFHNRISRSQVYKQAKAGEIPTIKIGRRVFVPAWFVLQLISKPAT